jgi:AcrR family transcriptional regulator
MATTERPLRRDAEHNRQLILDAARAVFAEEGLDVGLHEIAKRAGVGVGTIYRRFPDKEELIDALFEDRIGEVVAMAEAALGFEDAWQGLRHFLVSVMELQAADRGLYDCIFSRGDTQRRAALGREQIAPLVIRLVARGQEQGTLRADVTGYDIGVLRQMIGTLIEKTRDIDPNAWRRYLEIALDGLRASRADASPLPGRPPDASDFERTLRRQP